MRKLIFPILVCVNMASQAQNEYLSPEQESELDRRGAINALRELFPAPNMIKEGNKIKDLVDEAAMESLKPPAEQRIRPITIRRDEQKIHKLHVYPNQITTLTLADSMGHPWPLKAPPIAGAHKTYSIHYDEKNPGFITIETKAKFVPSNMVIALQGRLRPIQFQLYSDNRILDSIVDIKINGKSPLNKTQIARPYGGLSVPVHDSNNLSQFLGMPPEEAKRLTTVGDKEVTIWRWGESFVIRAPYTLLHPSEPVDVQSALDSEYTVYLVNKDPLVTSFLNERTSQIINVEVVGG